MSTRIVRSREAVRPHESFLQFSVYRSTQDGQICGYQIYNRGGGEHENTFITTPFGVPIAKAWRPACEFVHDNDIQVVWLNDPENLFDLPEDIVPAGRESGGSGAIAAQSR